MALFNKLCLNSGLSAFTYKAAETKDWLSKFLKS